MTGDRWAEVDAREVRDAFGFALDDYTEQRLWGPEVVDVVSSLHVGAGRVPLVDVSTLVERLMEAAGIAREGQTGSGECFAALWAWEELDGHTVVAGTLARLAGRAHWWSDNVG